MRVINTSERARDIDTSFKGKCEAVLFTMSTFESVTDLIRKESNVKSVVSRPVDSAIPAAK